MTSREATSLLPRAGSTLVLDSDGRTLADWAAIIGFGAFQWPWLARGLHGGRLEDKHALLDRLELPYDALPNLGSWKADTGLLTLVTDHIFEHRPSGWSSSHRRLDPDHRPRIAVAAAAS